LKIFCIFIFLQPVRQCSSPSNPLSLSSSTSIDYNSQEEFQALIRRPQSTPISSPILSINNHQTNENLSTTLKTNQKRRFDSSSLTDITPLNDINNKIKSPILFEILDDEEEENETNDRYFLRPPPLMVLSQSIQAKHPEQLNETKLNNRFSSIKDLPNAPANYSFVFYNFTSMFVYLNQNFLNKKYFSFRQIDEAKRLTRRMGDCFTSEMIDLTTTHVILPNDDPHRPITLDLILALIYGWLVSFD
jgi:hypothetical protein